MWMRAQKLPTTLLIWLLGWSGNEARAGLLLLMTAAPTVFFMRVPLPTGLARLHACAPRLVPWAWGVNGVASVMAASAAIAVAMTAGYRSVVLLAGLAYLVAGVALWRLRPLRPATRP